MHARRVVCRMCACAYVHHAFCINKLRELTCAQWMLWLIAWGFNLRWLRLNLKITHWLATVVVRRELWRQNNELGFANRPSIALPFIPVTYLSDVRPLIGPIITRSQFLLNLIAFRRPLDLVCRCFARGHLAGWSLAGVVCVH